MWESDRNTSSAGYRSFWKVASDFMFRKEAGGGVLADTGAHLLDLLLWWLGDYESVEYCDDAVGGVEADCELSYEAFQEYRSLCFVIGVINDLHERVLRFESAINYGRLDGWPSAGTLACKLSDRCLRKRTFVFLMSSLFECEYVDSG